MEIDPTIERHARQAIWDFLMQRRLRSGRPRCYLVSYPRSGSTLVRDYFAALQGRPQLSIYADDVVQPNGQGLTASLDAIDLVKRHDMPADDAPVIYLVRDGRNAVLSFLYMSHLFGGHRFSGLDEVYDAIRWIDDREGTWSNHVARALGQVNARPVLFVRYEDLVANPERALDEMMRFLGVEVPAPVLGDCVCRQRASNRYAANPYNGFSDQPAERSIYALIRQHRRGAYWRHIFDERSRRYFHACGATEVLMRFGYEDTQDWWKSAGAVE